MSKFDHPVLQECVYYRGSTSLLLCSEDTRSGVVEMREKYVDQENILLTETSQYKKETEVAFEELRRMSFIQKGLKRGEFFI